MKMKIIILLCLYFCSNQNLHSQVSLEWSRIFHAGSTSVDEPKAMTVDLSGNSIITGRVNPDPANDNYGTVKYSPTGVQLWFKMYDGPDGEYDVANAVTTDGAGNVYVTGQSRNATFYYDIVTIKYDPSGNVLWEKRWSHASGLTDVGSAVSVDNSGNVYVTGSAATTGNNTDYITLKYNSAGDLQWAKAYNGTLNNYDNGMYVRNDAAGNVYVCGESYGQGTFSDYVTIKYSPSGDSSWVRRFSNATSTNEIPQGFAVDRHGNAYLCGFTASGSSNINYATIKYNTAGVQQWAVFYDSTGGQDIPESIAVDTSGNVFVTGATRINSTYNDFATIKYNSAGVRQWIRIWGNEKNKLDDYGLDLVTDNSGNVYVSGLTNTNGSDYNVVTIKYDAAGNEKWLTQFDNDDEEGYFISLDNEDNVIVGGYTDGDYLLLKYSQTNGISTISTEVPSQYTLYQNYPNPFNPTTNIRYSITATSHVDIRVYDIRGKEITRLVNRLQGPGTYETDFDGSGLTSGVYYYTMIAGEFADSKKLLLVK